MSDKLHSETLESFLLSACMLKENDLSYAIEHCRADYFYTRFFPKIWDAIKKLYYAGKPVTPETVGSYFANNPRAQKNIEEIRLDESNLATFDVEYAVNRLRDLWQRRQMIWKLEGLIEDLQEETDPEATVDKDIESLEGFLYDLTQETEKKGPNQEGMMSALRGIEAALKSGGVVGVSTGFSSLDQILGGFAKQNLIIVAGRPSMGKTSLALCMAELIQQSIPTLFCSLEMSAEEISCKRLSLRTNIPTTKMREGKITPDEQRLLMDNSTPGNLWIDDTPALSCDKLLARARRLKKEQNIGCIVVDYLQLMQASKDARRQGAVQATTEISKKLKAVAKELDLPVIALSQLSRAVEQRENKRPVLSDLRESGSIEQDADSVLFVYRDEYYLEREQPSRYDRESDEKWAERLGSHNDRLEQAKGKADVIVAKNRHGKIGTATLKFTGMTTKFEELENV